jgi:hypothetical protein
MIVVLRLVGASVWSVAGLASAATAGALPVSILCLLYCSSLALGNSEELARDATEIGVWCWKGYYYWMVLLMSVGCSRGVAHAPPRARLRTATTLFFRARLP